MYQKRGKRMKTFKKTYVIISIVIFTILTFALVILNSLDIWYFKVIFEVIEETANLLYLVSGFLLIIGLYIAYSQLNLLKVQLTEQIKGTDGQLHFIKEDMRIRNHKAAVEKSIEYLHLFANDIIPRMNNYNKNHSNRKEIRITNWNPSESGYKLDILNLPDQEKMIVLAEMENRHSHDLLGILNNLEFFSAGIINGLGMEEVVYDPIAQTYLKFVSQEIVELSSQRFMGSPFKNTIELYILWKMRKKAESESLQIGELEGILEEKKQALNDLKSDYQTPTHIGG